MNFLKFNWENPDFINEVGIKWWHMKCLTDWAAGEGPIHESQNYEHISAHIDMLRLVAGAN